MKKNNRYILDKRDVKQYLKKYGLILLFSFPLLVVINFFLQDYMKNSVLIFLDIAIVFAVIVVVNLNVSKFTKKRNETATSGEVKVEKVASDKDTKKD